MNPEISVVIPAYNHEAYVCDCIESVLKQSSPPLEIIVVDDGSTDDTLERVSRLASRNSIIKIFSQENHGAHHAINRGVEAAGSRYIAVLNSDDQFLAGKLARCKDMIVETPKAGLIVGGVEFMDENGGPVRSGVTVDWYARALAFYAESGELGLSLLNENFVVTTSNMVFSKELWEQSGGFQPLRYCHDLEFLMEACRNSCKVIVSQVPMIRYRVHPGNTIKEEIQRVRVEIAAVIAHAVVSDWPGTTGRNPAISTIRVLHRFLRNKNLSDLIVFLVARYLDSVDKNEFYRDVLPVHAKEIYALLLD